MISLKTKEKNKERSVTDAIIKMYEILCCVACYIQYLY